MTACSISGFQSSITIKEITNDHIAKMEQFAREIEELLNLTAEVKSAVCDATADHFNRSDKILHLIRNLIFGSIYASNSKEFCFDNDDREIIWKVVKFTRKQIENKENGESCCFIFEETKRDANVYMRGMYHLKLFGSLFHNGWYLNIS